MTAYTELVGEVTAECAGAPEPIVVRHIRNAVIEFCEKSKALKRTLDTIAVQGEQSLYPLNPPTGYTIIEVLNGQIGSRDPLEQASQDRLDLWWTNFAERPEWFSSLCSCSSSSTSGAEHWRQLEQQFPEAFYVDRESDEYRIRLIGVPTADLDTTTDGLIVRVAVKPTRVSTEVASWLVDEYFDTLVVGAKGRLMRMPDKEWTNLQLAGVYLTDFESRVNAARLKSMRDFTRDDKSVGHVRAWP